MKTIVLHLTSMLNSQQSQTTVECSARFEPSTEALCIEITEASGADTLSPGTHNDRFKSFISVAPREMNPKRPFDEQFRTGSTFCNKSNSFRMNSKNADSNRHHQPADQIHTDHYSSPLLDEHRNVKGKLTFYHKDTMRMTHIPQFTSCNTFVDDHYKPRGMHNLNDRINRAKCTHYAKMSYSDIRRAIQQDNNLRFEVHQHDRTRTDIVWMCPKICCTCAFETSIYEFDKMNVATSLNIFVKYFRQYDDKESTSCNGSAKQCNELARNKRTPRERFYRIIDAITQYSRGSNNTELSQFQLRIEPNNKPIRKRYQLFSLSQPKEFEQQSNKKTIQNVNRSLPSKYTFVFTSIIQRATSHSHYCNEYCNRLVQTASSPFVKQESTILCFDDATVHSTSLNQPTTHRTQTPQLHAPFSLKLNANWINVLQHTQSTILTNSDTNTLKKMFKRVFPSCTFIYEKWTLDSHGISIPTSKLWKMDQDIYCPEILLESRPRTGLLTIFTDRYDTAKFIILLNRNDKNDVETNLDLNVINERIPSCLPLTSRTSSLSSDKIQFPAGKQRESEANNANEPPPLSCNDVHLASWYIFKECLLFHCYGMNDRTNKNQRPNNDDNSPSIKQQEVVSFTEIWEFLQILPPLLPKRVSQLMPIDGPNLANETELCNRPIPPTGALDPPATVPPRTIVPTRSAQLPHTVPSGQDEIENRDKFSRHIVDIFYAQTLSRVIAHCQRQTTETVKALLRVKSLIRKANKTVRTRSDAAHPCTNDLRRSNLQSKNMQKLTSKIGNQEYKCEPGKHRRKFEPKLTAEAPLVIDSTRTPNRFMF